LGVVGRGGARCCAGNFNEKTLIYLALGVHVGGGKRAKGRGQARCLHAHKLLIITVLRGGRKLRGEWIKILKSGGGEVSSVVRELLNKDRD
jgi:hypothetical protein